MNNEISKIISFLRFPTTVLVVILHAYTTTRGIINVENSVWYNHISYIFSLNFGEIGVPMFFFISGYLFFQKYSPSLHCYIEKNKRRIKTLLIPYIIWNTIFIFTYWILQNIDSINTYFSGANMAINDYKLVNYFRAYWDSSNWDKGNGVPILQPYWYIRNLIILCIISPIIAILIKYLKWITFIIPLLFWIFSLHLALIYSSLTFFILGAILAIHNTNIITLIRKWESIIYISFITLFIYVYVIHFYYPNNFELYIHRVTLVIGIPLFFCLAYRLKDKIQIKSLYSQSSFIIYTLHLPVMLALRKFEYKMINNQTELGNVILYIISIYITIWICIIIYKIINKYYNKFLVISTGR
ncbi:MAG: acyltransferase [Bacteroides sp.]|nr:acyltransferase [Bacteroides sp.]